MSVSTLFCSQQVLNIMHQVDERDLEHLQSLTFLIRDWEREYEFVCGESTDEYLRSFLRNPSQSKEVENVRKYISSTFEEICCFLLPHPGKKVPRFEGTLTNKAMDKDFQMFTKILVERILHPNNIVVKKCRNRREATPDDLLHLICAVGNAYKSGKLPTAETMLQSVVRANNANSLGQAVLLYKEMMEELCHGRMDDNSLMKHHSLVLKRAESRFRELATLGDEYTKEDFLQQLRRECEDAFVTIKERNEGNKKEFLRILELSIHEIASDYKGTIEQVQLENERHYQELESEQRQLAFEQFDSNALELTDVTRTDADRLRTKFRKKLDGISKDVKINRERERWALGKKKKDECDKCMYEILKKFRRGVEQHEDSYVENLPTILEKLKQNCLEEYDKKTASNSERGYVDKNKETLDRDAESCKKQAILLNENQKLVKYSRLSHLARECLSNYRENINAADSGSLKRDHEIYKRRTLEKFDAQCESCDAESTKLRMGLERDISFVYNNVKTVMERDCDAQVQAAIGAIILCRNKIFRQFQASVDKYGSQYYEDFEEILKKEKRDKLIAYDKELNSNTERNAVRENKREISNEMDEYIDKASKRNKDQQIAKKSRLSYLVSECKSDYREYVKTVSGP